MVPRPPNGANVSALTKILRPCHGLDGEYSDAMSTVNEIEAALSRLPVEDLESLEKAIYRLKHQGHDDEGFEYLQREYGITRDEWERFRRHREKEIEADRAQGRMKLFTGDIEQDLQD